MRTIAVSTTSGSYAVTVGSGLLPSISRRIARLVAPRARLFVITSPEIWALWGERFSTGFDAPPTVLFVPAGEQQKRLAQVERLCAELASAGADRSSVLIAFGGGVIGDVAGFVAAIYMRGIPFVQVPTTLLAQVDSSVGGKTGVNLASGKNLVGAFHQPLAVFADIDVLRTLPARELHAGLQESIKAGLIRDRSLFRYLETNREEISDAGTLEKIVAASVRIKAEVVSLDEKESGLRMILNFGHTLGHALEAAGGYGSLLHGEAVAWGMLGALHISRARGLSAAEATRAERLIRSFTLPAPPPVKPQTLLRATSGDKKNLAGVRRFVLLKRIGEAEVVEHVSDQEVLAAIESIYSASPQASAPARGSRR